MNGWNKGTQTGSGYTPPANKATLDKIGESGGSLTFGGSPLGGGSTPTNKATLDKFGESGGQPTFNGSIIAGGTNPSAVDRTTENLYDKALLVNGTYHNAGTGVITNGGMETHPIPVKPCYTYVFNKGDGIATQFSFYDSADVYLTGASNIYAKAPANAAWLRVYIQSTAVSDVLMVMESTYWYDVYMPHTQKVITTQPVQGFYRSKWYEKVWWVLGDSISTGSGPGVPHSEYAQKPYHYLLARERRITVQNDASSGYTIGNVYTNKVLNMPPTAYAPDLITIMAGTNDHGFNLSIGAITDATTVNSFYGTYKKTIEYLQTQYPYASIGLITPIQRKNASIDGNNNNAAGFTLRKYCDAVVALGNYYSIPVLDWYTSLGFTPYDTNQLNNYYCGSPSDGTHPNDFGHAKMAAKVGDFIEKL